MVYITGDIKEWRGELSRKKPEKKSTTSPKVYT